MSCIVMTGRKIDVAMRTPRQYVCGFDDILTNNKQEGITSFVNIVGHKFALKPAQLVACIREQFPFIKSINTHLVPPRVMKISFITTKPIARINDDMLVVPPKTICPTSWFQELHYISLPVIAIDELVLKNMCAENLVKILKTITSKVFDKYTVALKTTDELWLTDKVEPRLSLVCRTNKIPTDKLCEYGAQVKSLLESKGCFASRRIKSWLADLRFEKQIILSKR